MKAFLIQANLFKISNSHCGCTLTILMYSELMRKRQICVALSHQIYSTYVVQCFGIYAKLKLLYTTQCTRGLMVAGSYNGCWEAAPVQF